LKIFELCFAAVLLLNIVHNNNTRLMAFSLGLD